MKKIFEILQEERNRILEMHQNATKRQYLNETGDGYDTIYDRKTLTPTPTTPTTPKKPSTPKKSSYTTTQWNELRQGLSALYGITKGAIFQVTNNNKIIRSKNANIMFTGESGKWEKMGIRSVSFYCQKGKFYVQGLKGEEFYNETLGNALIKNVCFYNAQPDQNKQPQQQKLTDKQKLERAKNCGHSTWDAYQKSGWSCSGSQNTAQPNSGEPINQEPVNQAPTQSNPQVVDLNTQIQQLLGNQSPTGQISDAEIDQILAKLG